MYGSTVEKLSLLLTEDGKSDVTLWSVIDNQGEQWLTHQGDYSSSSMNQMVKIWHVFDKKKAEVFSLQVTIEVVIGKTFSSDIAIDNVEIFSGTCASGPAPFSTGSPVAGTTAVPTVATGANTPAAGTGTPGKYWYLSSYFND